MRKERESLLQPRIHLRTLFRTLHLITAPFTQSRHLEPNPSQEAGSNRKDVLSFSRLHPLQCLRLGTNAFQHAPGGRNPSLADSPTKGSKPTFWRLFTSAQTMEGSTSRPYQLAPALHFAAIRSDSSAVIFLSVLNKISALSRIAFGALCGLTPCTAEMSLAKPSADQSSRFALTAASSWADHRLLFISMTSGGFLSLPSSFFERGFLVFSDVIFNITDIHHNPASDVDVREFIPSCHPV